MPRRWPANIRMSATGSSFTWDGVGFGDDGDTVGRRSAARAAGRWRRVASMRPFRLPGGDRAGREPWRSAAALCGRPGGLAGRDSPAPNARAHRPGARRIGTPRTSSVGRLFDAAAALSRDRRASSYEGQGPMMLESIAAAEMPTAVPLAARRATRRTPAHRLGAAAADAHATANARRRKRAPASSMKASPRAAGRSKRVPSRRRAIRRGRACRAACSRTACWRSVSLRFAAEARLLRIPARSRCRATTAASPSAN